MRSIVIAIALTSVSLLSHAQKPRIINVEKLNKPKAPLQVASYEDIIKNMVRIDHDIDRFPATRRVDPEFNIVAKSRITDSLVNMGYHPFFFGMYQAYADHRPFTLSPDMIWLLISQGFANHVNNNAEKLRPMFVNFSGKTSLVVQNNKIKLDDPNSPWEQVFPDFIKQISTYTGTELNDALTANFSTTTPTTKMASEITALAAMKSYFDFIVIYVGCGIPKVTLEGTPADWQKVLDKTEALRKYDLGWWVDKMEPILKKILLASKGKNDKEFWQTMFKYHSVKLYGVHTMIDGWIVKFYPYSRKGYRLNLDSLTSGSALPDEMVKVDLKHIAIDAVGNPVTTPLELSAGFVGLKQNNKDFGLQPEIGWYIRKKDNLLEDKKMAQLRQFASNRIDLRVTEVPEALMEIGPINFLTLDFVKGINIPNEFAKVPIKHLRLRGEIDDSGIQRLKKLFPNSDLYINNQAASNSQATNTNKTIVIKNGAAVVE